MALHEQSVGASSEWYTPAYVFEALECQFDVDVASPGHVSVPWIPAAAHLTAGSLTSPWSGFVWMNAPFGGRNGLAPWLEKFFEHGNGIALVPDRTSAPWWGEYAHRTGLVLFVFKKIRFININGVAGASPAQGTALWALGPQARVALKLAALNGLGGCYRPEP